MQFRKYTKEDFILAIQNSFSIAEALTKLGVRPYGGNYHVANKYIRELKLDTSHMTGQNWNKGKTTGPKRPIEDYLSNKRNISSHKLRLRLIDEGFFEHKCCSCKRKTWLKQLIPLELDHINGNHLDNTLSNLRLLCPNCHAFTPNYRGKNK